MPNEAEKGKALNISFEIEFSLEILKPISEERLASFLELIQDNAEPDIEDILGYVRDEFTDGEVNLIPVYGGYSGPYMEVGEL